MNDRVAPIAEWAAAGVEVIGIGVIAVFAAYGLGLLVWRIARRTDAKRAIDDVRRRLGRGIVLGLEFLAAADIIHTVAVELTRESVGV